MEIDSINKQVLREYLVNKDSISIPMLQKDFDLTYVIAKRVLSSIISRAWATDKAEGVYYKVIPENMFEIDLTTKQIKRLSTILTSDCIQVISCLYNNDQSNYSDLLKEVRGKNDTNEAIKMLINEKVIREVKGNYFLCITQSAVDMIIKLYQTVINRRRKPREYDADIQAELNRKFDELFGFSNNDASSEENNSDDDDGGGGEG